MNKKILLAPAFLLGSLCIYCTETAITAARDGSSEGDGGGSPIATAHAEPTSFSVLSEGTFTQGSSIISVEGAARISVAVSAQTDQGTTDPECEVIWTVPDGKLAKVGFVNAISNLRLPMNNRHNDLIGPMPVVLPKILLWCDVKGPVDYIVYGIK